VILHEEISGLPDVVHPFFFFCYRNCLHLRVSVVKPQQQQNNRSYYTLTKEKKAKKDPDHVFDSCLRFIVNIEGLTFILFLHCHRQNEQKKRGIERGQKKRKQKQQPQHRYRLRKGIP
jgi:hypothetical protein